jgi:Tol biopolymer transport system component
MHRVVPPTLFRVRRALGIVIVALGASLCMACRDTTGVENTPARLVFLREPFDTLFVSDSRNGTIEQRIALNMRASRFGFSSLGDRLAVVSGGALWLMNPDGSAATRLVSSVGNFAWSPDGSRIAYVQSTPHEVHVIGADGRGDTVVPGTAAGGFQGLAWSPDGTRIAFEGIRQLSPGETRTVYVVNVDGSGLRDIDLTLPGPARRASGEPTWSPDGRKLSISRSFLNPDGTRDTQLWVVTLANGDARRITSGAGDAVRPAWSPAGGQIAFLRFLGATPDVFVVRPDGGGLRQITSTPEREEAPQYWHSMLY